MAKAQYEKQYVADFHITDMKDVEFSEWLKARGWKGDVNKIDSRWTKFVILNGDTIKVLALVKYKNDEPVSRMIWVGSNIQAPTLTEIINANAKFVKNSGFSLTVDVPHSWVSLSAGTQESLVFLQNEEAENVLEEANNLYHETGDTLLDDCIMHVMKGWIENL